MGLRAGLLGNGMTEETAESLKTTAIELLEMLAGLLVVSWLFSWLAPFYWLFDLFSHFLLQYTIGGGVLGLALLALKRWTFAVLALLIATASFAEARLTLDNPWQFSPPGPGAMADQVPVTLVQFNQHVLRRDFKPVEAWLRRNADRFDIVILQEASHAAKAAAKGLRDVYPHQLAEPRDHAFGMAVLSRHELIEQEVIPVKGPVMETFIVRIVLQPPGAKAPLAVYAVHAVPPVGHGHFKQRNLEIAQTGKLVAADRHENIVMAGDWNLTPFSPFFTRLREQTGLRYQAFGVLMNVTWPVFARLDFLKIPIDHVLTGKSIRLISKRAGPAFGSDHHALVVKLGLAPE